MKIHTTNYKNVFIEVAEDCPVDMGVIPPLKGDKKTIANMQFEILNKAPYQYTSDEVLFQVFANRNDLTQEEFAQAKSEFFSKGQPCFRASPLTKRYGFGIHCNEESKIAMYGMETLEYAKYLANKSIGKVKAMRSKRG
ncbi:DUF6157 family protein [Cyclobacterium amurskyense]|uniref:Uncharacterized protein n=1 Tax=Cyclobacterium amurskyense TaxID=320787 RepID=A0A0H4PHG7_9BACT|nr:DUF6157 family protein [Cyclobacterium amurskyense]AKP52465.1 hypothetical protein CA2015_3063 [Cyclobacterium amurskyense]